MLDAMHEALIESLNNLKANSETVQAYRKRWDDTLSGRAKGFACPSCFVAGKKDTVLASLPAKDSTHFVKCESCGAVYSYIDEDF